MDAKDEAHLKRCESRTGRRFLLVAGLTLLPAAVPADEVAGPERPGRFHVGPFYVTPIIRVGTIGVDTNTLFERDDRQRDVNVRGGPGLEVVLPLTKRFRFVTDGALDYQYFADHEDQRRLTGSTDASFVYLGSRLNARLGRGYARRFERPAFEIDRRVRQGGWHTRADLQLVQGTHRFGLESSVTEIRHDVESGQEVFGNDLRRNLARDERRASLGLSLRLTPKTSLVAVADHQQDRFLVASGRNADSNRLYGGFRVVSSSLLSGQVAGGVRWFRPIEIGSKSRRPAPFFVVDLTFRQPRTLLRFEYTQDLQFSAFEHADGSTTFVGETIAARIEKGLIGRLSLWLSGRTSRVRRDQMVIHTIEGVRTVVDRNDRLNEATADLGYLFPWKLRLGIAATYRTRQSPIGQFGISGLVVGASIYFGGKPSISYRP